MKSTAIVCAIAASALGFSSLSFAQASGLEPELRSDRREERREDRREERQARREARQDQQRQHQPQQWQHRQYQSQQQHVYQPRHGRHNQWSGHAQRYQRGDQLPYQFRQRQYYVNDWRSHRGLYAPPSGYHWVQADGGDYLLVALATGLIANLLLNQY